MTTPHPILSIGASKAVAACELGEDVVQEIRTGLYTRPPPMTPSHPHWHATDAKYWDLDPSEIPLAECLFDTIERTRPLLEERILPEIRAGKTIMVVAHANAIRGICKYLDDLSEDEVGNARELNTFVHRPPSHTRTPCVAPLRS